MIIGYLDPWGKGTLNPKPQKIYPDPPQNNLNLKPKEHPDLNFREGEGNVKG